MDEHRPRAERFAGRLAQEFPGGPQAVGTADEPETRESDPCRGRDPQAAMNPAATPLRHVGLYCYRRSFLATYRSLTPTPAEQAESLEQLRVLEHGYSIAVAVVPDAGNPGIDTPDQYAAFIARWKRSGR